MISLIELRYAVDVLHGDTPGVEEHTVWVNPEHVETVVVDPSHGNTIVAFRSGKEIEVLDDVHDVVNLLRTAG